MSDSTPDNRPEKRKNLTPEALQDKEKLFRQYESLPQSQHPSVLNASDLNLQTSPVGAKSLNIVQRCELAGISEAGGKGTLETVFTLINELSARVTSLEEVVAKKDEEIFNLRRDHANLEKQLSDLRSEKSDDKTEDNFIEVMKKEFPTISDHVASNETQINKIRERIDKMEEDSEPNEADADITEQNNTLQQIQQTQVEDRKYFLRESRKLHLEGDHRDQYTMRETIRVSGVPFKRGENTNDIICRIAYSIGVNITPEDISVSHRTGRRNTGRPRPIICKFTRRETKYRILHNKKLARHIRNDDEGNPVQIYIDEKLTPMRANVCRLLRNEKIQHHTKDGKIFLPKSGTDEFTVLDTTEDWMNWERSDKIKMELGVYPKI